MATFGTMVQRLSGILARELEERDIKILLNRVHQEEVEAHSWSFRRSNTVITTVAPISAGTVSVAQGSATVTGVGTAFTAAMVGYVIRLGQEDSYFTVTAVDVGLQTLTIEVAWPSAALAASPYVLFPLFYSLPSTCQLVLSVKRLVDLQETTREEINRRDPSRRSTANPSLAWAPAGWDSSQNYRLEFWPVNSAAVGYVTEFLVGHTPMQAPSDRPLVPGAVIENKALHDALMQIYHLNGDARFFQSAQMYWQRYGKELQDAIQVDHYRYGQIRQVQDAGGGASYGADYTYNHDV